MKFVKCECGASFAVNKADLHTRYKKKKPNGVFVARNAVYCPECDNSIEVNWKKCCKKPLDNVDRL